MTEMQFADEMKPIYAVGDRVLITNPIDIFDVEDTTVYTIADVKFSERYCTFFYRINNRWVNESWLEPDIFGPQYLDEELTEPTVDVRKLLTLEQDYELLSLHDAIVTHNKCEQTRSLARLHEIHNELEALKC